MWEGKTVQKVSSCKALERRKHWGDCKHCFVGSIASIEKKARKTAPCAVPARLAAIQRAARTVDGHKARSHGILFVFF